MIRIRNHYYKHSLSIWWLWLFTVICLVNEIPFVLQFMQTITHTVNGWEKYRTRTENLWKCYANQMVMAHKKTVSEERTKYTSVLFMPKKLTEQTDANMIVFYITQNSDFLVLPFFSFASHLQYTDTYTHSTHIQPASEPAIQSTYEFASHSRISLFLSHCQYVCIRVPYDGWWC